MPELTVKNLNLSQISDKLKYSFEFSVHPGQSLGISGPSGIGKSVLLKAIADMLPHDGQVFLDNIESQSISAPQWRKNVALLPAESQWWFETVGEHFKEFNESLFQSLGFTKDVLSWQISHLSSGEKQRLACLRVLVNQPKALLLDEPTANLDKENREKLENLIREYQAENQVPLLWVSHDTVQLNQLCEEVLHLHSHNYEIKAIGAPA
jgi:ABC-type iron transport system FetAB ATPase subunit